MFRHDDISHNYEPIALAGLFQNREEVVAVARAAQTRQSPVARTGDKVQVMGAVTAMQAARHDKQIVQAASLPALANNARTGHPPFRNGKEKHRKVDWIRAKARFDPVFFGLRIKDAGKKGVFAMMIIGCDFHPSWQQIAWLDSETGETGEQKLVHASGDAKMFYQQLAAPVLIGMEATGNSQWFIELVEDLGHEIWIGDAAQIRASYVRKQKTDKRDAAHILKLGVEARLPRVGRR